MEANKTILQMKYARIVPIFAEQTGITPRVPEDTFSEVATRLSRPAEPSRQVC